MAYDYELRDSIRIYKPADEGTIAASSPVLLEWKNLSVRIGSSRTWSFKKKSEDSKYILKHATGAVRSGDLVAVMGSSGSGKTTMLAAVSMRLTAEVQGSVLINGLFVNPTQMKRLSGFVPQFEIALNSLTVREHLTFVAKLKGVGRAQTEAVIHELNLEQCASTRISHLSGGERKKVNLAGELLTEPDILFCDEPTTGLDSFSALAVINTLRKLAVDSRKAVICTIHHPTSDIFECFSDVILLNRGRTYYQGPTVEATSFFESISLPLPINCNPADYYFKLVCDSDGYENAGSSEASAGESRDRRQEIVRKCQRENVAKKSLMGPYQQSDVIDKLYRNTSHACWPSQLYLLLHRGILDSIRNLREYIIVTFLFLITSITISALYFHIDPSTGGQTSIQDIRGALFLVVCELLYTLSYSVFYVFPRDLPLVRREVGERTYRLSAYYAHRALLTVPKAFFESFLFVGIVYGCVRFTAVAGAATYVGMATVSAVASLLAVAYGYLLTCLSGSMELSIEYANLIFLLYGLLGGLYLNIRAFPVAKYLSFFFFAAEGISVYYWRTVQDIPCDLDETMVVNGTSTTTTSCLRDGLAVLEDTGYGTSLDVVYFNYLVMAGQIVAIHVLAYFCLRRLVKKAGFY